MALELSGYIFFLGGEGFFFSFKKKYFFLSGQALAASLSDLSHKEKGGFDNLLEMVNLDEFSLCKPMISP